MEQHKKNRFTRLKGCVAICFWILMWQLLVIVLDRKSGGLMGGRLLVASPLETVKTLFSLIQTADFWKAVGHSFGKIAGGFFLAVLAGVICAVIASGSGVIRALLTPVLRLIKAVPVASFIILALFWLSSSRNLSVLISFLMVLPVIYTNVLQGIESTEKELLEMATVFRIPFGKRIRFIYLPAVLPYFVSACSVGLGFCFKSGIAAEIIGLPANSIGERLYEAKLYLLTEDLFAWTAVIVLVSVVFEKAVMLLVKAMERMLTGKGKVSEYEALSGSESNTTEIPEAAEEEKRFREETIEKKESAESLYDKKQGTDEQEEAVTGTAVSEDYGLYEVTKRFEEKTVLERFSLRLAPGETVALMGASGCGKSTAGKLLLGILPAEEGTVKRPKYVGAVFQEDRLCKEFDGITNIAMVTGNRKEAAKALEEVGLPDVEGIPVAALSGGMKRRVAIVRAMLSKGELLVLDEPFTGLDEKNRQAVAAYVKKNLRGRSALLITHNAEEAEALAERVVYVKK